MEQKVVKFEIGKILAVVITIVVIAAVASVLLQSNYFKGNIGAYIERVDSTGVVKSTSITEKEMDTSLLEKEAAITTIEKELAPIEKEATSTTLEKELIQQDSLLKEEAIIKK